MDEELERALKSLSSKQDTTLNRLHEFHAETQGTLGKLEAHSKNNAEHIKSVSQKADDIRQDCDESALLLSSTISNHKDNGGAHGLEGMKWVIGIGFSLIAAAGTVVAMAK